MASDKPLPDADDDIIDLTDLVEEGGAGNGAADDNGVDMSFEQELDDLFGDAEPLPTKTRPAASTKPPAVATWVLAMYLSRATTWCRSTI